MAARCLLVTSRAAAGCLVSLDDAAHRLVRRAAHRRGTPIAGHLSIGGQYVHPFPRVLQLRPPARSIRCLVGTDTVTAQGHSPWTGHARSGDFYLATIGDFSMATDTASASCKAEHGRTETPACVPLRVRTRIQDASAVVVRSTAGGQMSENGIAAAGAKRTESTAGPAEANSQAAADGADKLATDAGKAAETAGANATIARKATDVASAEAIKAKEAADGVAADAKVTRAAATAGKAATAAKKAADNAGEAATKAKVAADSAGVEATGAEAAANSAVAAVTNLEAATASAGQAADEAKEAALRAAADALGAEAAAHRANAYANTEEAADSASEMARHARKAAGSAAEEATQKRRVADGAGDKAASQEGRGRRGCRGHEAKEAADKAVEMATEAGEIRERAALRAADQRAARRARIPALAVAVAVLVALPLFIWALLWWDRPNWFFNKEPFALRFTEAVSAICAVGALALLGLALHGLLRAKQGRLPDPRLMPKDATASEDIVRWRRRGLKALVVGLDGRTSTSMVQATLWTGLTLFAGLFLLMVGRTPNCGGVYNDSGTAPWLWSTCAAKAPASQAFEVAFSDPSGALPLLLGLPIATAVFAKASAKVRQNKADQNLPLPGQPGTVVAAKDPVNSSDHVGVVAGLGQVVSNDLGDVDLLDAQYAIFNMLLAAVFLVLLLTRGVEDGLPQLPETLLILSGVTSGSYVVKKHLENSSAKEPAGGKNPTTPD